MTMMELQDILAKVLNSVTDDSVSEADHQKAIINAEYTAKIAKQMINNADIILRTDKLSGRNDRIDRVVGESNENNEESST